jgi:hypothetical protein
MAMPLRTSLPTLAMALTLSMRARWRLFLALTRMLVSTTAPAATGQSLDPRNFIGNREHICRMHVRRICGFSAQPFKEFLQFGQRLRTSGTCAAFFFRFLPVHFNKCNGVDHLVTDFPADHTDSFRRAFKRWSPKKLRALLPAPLHLRRKRHAPSATLRA